MIHRYSQQGQTLIETLVAAFILVMGISAAIGLASYSLGATTVVRQQTIALGLAREGLEVVKNMRDTNWLKGTLSDTCHGFYSEDPYGFCYTTWMTTPYNISGSPSGTTYYIAFDKSAAYPWTLVQSNTSFGLNFNTASSGGAYYDPGSGINATAGNSGFGRRITITKENGFAPFNQGDTDTGPRLKVTSEVWWQDKNCPMVDKPEDTTCKVSLVTYLTNWRTF